MDNKKTRMIVSLLMTVFLILSFAVTTGIFHIVAGVLFTALFVTHVLINRKWLISVTKSLGKGNLTAKVKRTYWVDVVLIALASICVISGLPMIGDVFGNGGSEAFRQIHHATSRFTLFLTIAHVIQHTGNIKSYFKGKTVIKVIVALVSAASVIGLSVFINSNTNDTNTQQTAPTGLELCVEPGKHWVNSISVLFISVDVGPQIAAWIEDNSGNYISTITVTNFTGQRAYGGSRPDLLPVWNHKIENTGEEQIDAVTSATPNGSFNLYIDKEHLIDGQEYNVYLETNHSFDYNDAWQRRSGDVNGQPSLVSHAKFIAGATGKIDLKPIGHGSVDGSDGDIVFEIEGITTPLSIIKEAYILLTDN